MDITTSLPVIPGTFYDMPNGFFLPIKALPGKTKITVAPKLPVSCMFDISLVTVDAERVGFFFATRFKVTNAGGYLLTTMTGKEEATEVETLIKNDDLIVYNYPNKGTLAITPIVSTEIHTIFQEQ